MRILYVTPWAPTLTTGGGRHCYYNLRALGAIPKVSIDYIGPPLPTQVSKELSHVLHVVLSRDYNWVDKIRTALRGDASSCGSLYIDAAARISPRSYELLFVETTRCGFVFRSIPRWRHSIVCLHNVEYDYLAANANGFSRLASWNCRHSESRTLAGAERILAMHGWDVERCIDLYGGDPGRYSIHPVCSAAPTTPPPEIAERPRQVLFAGSLGESFNREAILNFIRTELASLRRVDVQLVVAGASPSRELQRRLNTLTGVQLVANPPDIGALMRASRLLILPDLHGHGMKLRVAEALSNGLPIVSTRQGLRGYVDPDRYAIVVETRSGIGAVAAQLCTDVQRLQEMSCAAKEVWCTTYNDEVFGQRLRGTLSPWI